MKQAVRAALVAVCIPCMQVFAADKAPEWKTLNFPKEVVTRQDIADTPSGWASAREDCPHGLASVTISEGPPENKASLAYDEEAKVGQKLVASWRMDAETKEKYWISCSYSRTDIILKKALPDGIKELRITYDDETKTAGLPTVEKVEYR